jgi:hypothetical protein
VNKGKASPRDSTALILVAETLAEVGWSLSFFFGVEPPRGRPFSEPLSNIT